MPCHQLDLPRVRETIAALRIQVVAAERGQDQQASMRIAAETQPQYTLLENASLRPRAPATDGSGDRSNEACRAGVETAARPELEHLVRLECRCVVPA